MFAVGSGGVLSPLSGSPFATGGSVLRMAFSPGGSLLAAANFSANSISIFSVAAPTTTITAPANGGTYLQGQAVGTSFSCVDAPYAPGIASCTDANGQGSPAGHLDTSTPGRHTYAVTAVSADGQSSTASVSYFVIGMPTATINAPASAGPYQLGQSVVTAFSCVEAAGGPGIVACTDNTGHTEPAGSLDTSTVGSHTTRIRDQQGRARRIGKSQIQRGRPSADGLNRSVQTVRCHGSDDGCVSRPSRQQCTDRFTAITHVRHHGRSSVGVTARAHKTTRKPAQTTTTTTVAVGSLAISAGQRRTSRFRLNAAGRRLLGHFFRLAATLSFVGTALAPRTIAFSYRLVTSFPLSSWAYWSWISPPCGGVRWTAADTDVFFGIQSLVATAKVTVRCSGTGCAPPRSFGPGKRSVRLNELFAGRHLGPGTVIRVQITAPNIVGRLITWRTVVGASPKRTVQCLVPGNRWPVPCADQPKR